MRALLVAALLLMVVAAPGISGEETKVRVGGELRLRAEGYDNMLDLEDSAHDGYDYYRLRTRLSFEAAPRERLRFSLRLANEYKWGRGERTAGVKDAEGKVTLDNAWAEISIAAAGEPVFRFGRMDLTYGEGFLLWDGTPADGSSTGYFDALLLSWDRPLVRLDLLTAKFDEELSGQTTRAEDLYAIYAKHGGGEAYAMYRTKRRATASASGIEHPSQQTAVLGGRFSRLPENGLHVAAEAAYEFGEFDGRDAEGAGGYGRGGWTSSGPRWFGVEAGGLYLSGDDPDTKKHEGWDPFYSDWPKYSDLYVYTIGDNTSRIAGDDAGTWTNLSAFWIEGRTGWKKSTKTQVRAMWLQAPEDTGPGGGKERGFLVAGQLNWAFAPDLQAQFVGERFDPGDFYAPGSDGAWYGRWQITARF
jgi:hypothetical protein